MSTFRVCTNSNFFFKPKLFSEEEILERNGLYKEEMERDGGNVKTKTRVPVESVSDVGPVVESYEDIKEAVQEYDGDLRHPNAAAQECWSDFLVKADEKTLNKLADQELQKALNVTRGVNSPDVSESSFSSEELAKGLSEDIESAEKSLKLFRRIRRNI